MFRTACGSLPAAHFVRMGNQRPTHSGTTFLNPPATARPRVWWHWMNGNITKELDAELVTPKVAPRLSLFIFGQYFNRYETL